MDWKKLAEISEKIEKTKMSQPTRRIFHRVIDQYQNGDLRQVGGFGWAVADKPDASLEIFALVDELEEWRNNQKNLS